MSDDACLCIPALLPRTPGGGQFVFYGDCCSGVPGGGYAANFAAVNLALQRLRPQPEFIAFLGDHVFGLTADHEALRRQWRYWHEHEMAWLNPAIPHYPTTSNHNTYDAGSEAVWREVFPRLPRNGPPGQEGLSYWVRRGSFLLAAVNTSCLALGGAGHVECDWLARVLEQNRDARHKFVLGHHPAHPVNGYTVYPLWRMVPEEGRAFWAVLAAHNVLAYLCSHIIAFDVQVHAGVLQICSGGAGTQYGPGGFMPGPTEYHHFVQTAVDELGLRYQVVDSAGAVREQLAWPPQQPKSGWNPVAAGAEPDATPADCFLIYRFSGVNTADARELEQTLLCGWRSDEGPPRIRVGLAHSELVVEAVPWPGDSSGLWRGPKLAPGARFDVEIGLHPGMGPGGVLWRHTGSDRWSSLESISARGLESAVSPEQWVVGRGPSGPEDTPFRGRDLEVQRLVTPMPEV